MAGNRFIPLLTWMTLMSVASAIVYQCEPGTDATVCVIWNLHYDVDTMQNATTLPTVNMTDKVRSVRVTYERYYYSRLNLLHWYDSTLHSTVLHDPANVFVVNCRLDFLEIPSSLEMGDFNNNHISHIITKAGKPYALRYLDVSNNMLRTVGNLSVLVGLETLNLAGNRISVFEPYTFADMDKLSHLYLSTNSLSSVDLRVMPKSLTVLWMLRNGLTKLDLAGVSLPALRELDLESNRLKTLDLAALFTAFPALRSVPIAYNPFVKEEAQRIITDLKRRNVTYYTALEDESDVDCDNDEYRIEHLCFAGSVMGSRTFLKACFLIGLSVLVVGVFFLSVRWIWRQMRY